MLEQSPVYIKLTASTSQTSGLSDEPNSPKAVNKVSRFVLEVITTCPRGVFTTWPQNDKKKQKKKPRASIGRFELLYSAHKKKKKNKLWVDCVVRMQICVHLSHSRPICVLYLFRRHVRTVRQSLSTLAIFYLSTWHIRAPSLLLHYHLTVLKGLHGGRGGGNNFTMPWHDTLPQNKISEFCDAPLPADKPATGGESQLTALKRTHYVPVFLCCHAENGFVYRSTGEAHGQQSKKANERAPKRSGTMWVLISWIRSWWVADGCDTSNPGSGKKSSLPTLYGWKNKCTGTQTDRQVDR